MNLEQHIPALLRIWRQQHGRRGPIDQLGHDELTEVVRGVRRLSAGLGGDRQKAGRDYLSTPEGLGAYLLWFWPVSYAQTGAILRLGGLRPTGGRALDLGSGPGPVSRALWDSGWRDILAIDRARAALDAAATLCPGLHTQPWSLGDPLPEGPFDLIFAGHVFNELWKHEPDRIQRRLGLLDELAARLSPAGRIALLDPATHAVNRESLELRDAVAGRFAIEGPCFSATPCPALAAGAACHGTLNWQLPAITEQIGYAAHIDKSVVSFGWLVLRPGQRTPDDRLRVVSEQMLNKAGRERFLVCGAPGRFALSAPGKGQAPWRRVWKQVQRGDVLRVSAPELRESGWGLGPDSGLEISEI